MPFFLPGTFKQRDKNSAKSPTYKGKTKQGCGFYSVLTRDVGKSLGPNPKSDSESLVPSPF